MLAALTWPLPALAARADARHAASPRAHAAIVDGMPAQPGTFPWLAAVFHDGPGEAFQCTGTVVAPNVVLTAAHCAEDVRTGRRFSVSGYAVVTGNVNFMQMPRQVLGVSLTVIYPGFNRLVAGGDAALLVLSTPTTAPAIRLASRASDAPRLAAGRYAVMAGWGETFAGGPAPAELLWARTTVRSQRYCRAHARAFLPRQEICTLDAPARQTDACFGDSGGPLLGAVPSTGEVVELGVASHLYSQCLPSSPVVYTRTDLIRNWVGDWIASADYVPGTVSSASAPKKPSASATRPMSVAPGSYVARAPAGQKVTLRVATNGEWITGVDAKARLSCQNGASLPVSLSWRADSVFIYSGSASATLPITPGGPVLGGSASLSARFTAPAGLQGELGIRVEAARRGLGSCSGQLDFTAGRA